jgi:multidrug efflux pump subunit AcrA (membrane-fusion protein)
VAVAEAALERLKADQHRAAVVFDQARKDHDRALQLVSANAISEADRDKAIEALGIAEAGLTTAQAALIEGQKQLDVARQTLKYHRARLADTRITAFSPASNPHQRRPVPVGNHRPGDFRVTQLAGHLARHAGGPERGLGGIARWTFVPKRNGRAFSLRPRGRR